MRAVEPISTGYVERDGLSLGYEVFGEGEPTILLLPTWTIIHSRFWKMQAPYLSRHYRVITYDGPGNGRSDRSIDTGRYAIEEVAADGVTVLDELGVDRAIVIGLSRGAQYATRLAARYPERVKGVVLIGPALSLAPQHPDRAATMDNFHKPYPENPQGWEKYNIAYWHHDYRDFVQFFFGQGFSEPHSTKPFEDAVGWALETGPDILETEANRPPVEIPDTEILSSMRCPVLVIHGTKDRIQPYRVGEETARLTGGTLATLTGSGHFPNLRDPVQVNLLLRRFVEGLRS
jgi:pimeloyl-ACP methyl ester carboxylesterase